MPEWLREEDLGSGEHVQASGANEAAVNAAPPPWAAVQPRRRTTEDPVQPSRYQQPFLRRPPLDSEEVLNRAFGGTGGASTSFDNAAVEDNNSNAAGPARLAGATGARLRPLGSPPGRGGGAAGYGGGTRREHPPGPVGTAASSPLVFRLLGDSQEERLRAVRRIAGRWGATLLSSQEASPLWPTRGAVGAVGRGDGQRGRGSGVNDVTGISWSANGARLAIGTSGAVITYEVDGRGRRQFGAGGLQ